MFIESLLLLGSYLSQASEYGSALHIYNSLRILGNISANHKIKLEAMM